MTEDYRLREEQSTRRRANLIGIRYVDTSSMSHFPLFKGVLTNEEMYHYRAVVISQEPGSMIIAVTDKSPQQSLQQLKDKLPDYNITFVMISEAGFKSFMERYDPPKQTDYKDINIKPDEKSDSIEEVSATLESVLADDMLDYLIKQANLLMASDIHLENGADAIRVRFRVDGVLHDIAKISQEKFRQLMSSIAINANISTSAPQPQTGHMEYRIKDKPQDEPINMRIETVPTINGQDCVIRIFTLDRDLLKLENLGLNEDQRQKIDELINRPEGLVMAVGPTGSGKTTTLYSIINALNTPERKVVTLEDPVEYTVPGVIQIPVDTAKEDSFADKLRAVLRLDPDIIMIGEIRDPDTARTALQASLSGHLVLTTFHANDAPTALNRLLDMVGENPLFASAVRLIIAQRLVRTLDPQHRQPKQLEPHIKNRVWQIINDLPEGVQLPNVDQATFYEPVVSDQNPFGYVGQTAVVETLSITEGMQQILHRPPHEISTEELAEQARQDGMVTMMQDAIFKAMAGETTVEEAFRVVG